MAKKLVIVESPAKAKTINKILGRDYVVKASMGHVRDLPERTLGVDVEHNFKPKYVVVEGRKKVIAEIKLAAKDVEAIYLAPDPDREGEAIAWHLREVLKKDAPAFFRVQYNEITPRAVRLAFENPVEIDLNRVDAQQARRVLDRIVGYTVSPMLWRRVRKGLSAGRVQSVALRLVCERELEIRAFKPETYWVLGALVRKCAPPLDAFRVELSRINGEKAEVTRLEQAQTIRAELEGRALQVGAITIREITRRAPPPYITSTLQQAASTFCGFSPKRTMGIAQKLYEGVDLGEGPVGLITYMRTDSVSVSQDALAAVRSLIAETFGEAFCPEKPNFFKSRSGAQEAHEAIRPTDVRVTPERAASRLDPAELKLYRLIWERFVASQMAPARLSRRSVDIEALPPEPAATRYTFRAAATDVLFAGYMQVAGVDVKTDEEGHAQQKLPPLVEGEPIACVEWLSEQKETKPPVRFSEASLVRALERNGIGRPSTYAQIIATLQQRKYVIVEKRALQPTDLGMTVSELLVANLDALFNVTFTAGMEALLDKVERGDVQWTTMLAEFYTQFKQWMKEAADKVPQADPAAVQQALALMERVQTWAPPVTRGKRVYSDEKFTASIREQAAAGVKPLSLKQLDALLRIGWRSRQQIPEIEPLIHALGREALLAEPGQRPPCEAAGRKLELLRAVTLDAGGMEFVDSLRQQVAGGRSLSDPQTRALNNIVMANAAQIPEFEAIKDSLKLADSEAAQDRDSAPLLAAMAQVTEWKEPVTRGKRVFDDKAFVESLTSYHRRKGFLSPKQKGALVRLVRRYRAQIPGYEALAQELNLEKGAAGAQPAGGPAVEAGVSQVPPASADPVATVATEAPVAP